MQVHMTRSLLACTAALLLGGALAGCETMSPDECKYANWNDIGMRDGLAGQTISMLTDRANDCGKAGARVDTALYIKGREQGLQSFCRIENAAPLGLSGQAYAGVCPAMVDGEFRYRHQAGYAVYEMRNRVYDLDSRGERLQRRLRDADRDEEKQLKAADKEEDRKRIRKEFDERRRSVRNELRDLDRALHGARNMLRDAEYSLSNLR